MKLSLLILGALATLQALLLFANILPVWLCDAWHGRGLFPALRAVLGTPASLVPFSVAQLILMIGALLLLATPFELGLRWAGKIEQLRLAPWTLLLALTLLNAFFLGYGWLHKRPSLESRLRISAPTQKQVDTAALAVARTGKQLAEGLSAQELAITPTQLRELAHEAVRLACAELEIEAPPPFRLKHPWPDGFLMFFRSSGVFSPFTFEPHVDGGLHPAYLPFVACHELAHVAGIASESEANFLAWLACRRSPDPRFRLSSAIGVLSYFERDSAEEMRARIFATQGAQMIAIRKEVAQRFADAQQSRLARSVSKISQQAYDRMLKAHGVESGIRSYSLVTRLAAAWMARDDE
jgi:hypothetical protein